VPISMPPGRQGVAGALPGWRGSQRFNPCHFAAGAPHCRGGWAFQPGLDPDSASHPRHPVSPPWKVATSRTRAGPGRQRRHAMPTGTVKWFNPQKGYGFIQPSDGSQDVFVHISALERAGLATLQEGQRLSFDLEQGQRGKTSAVNLQAA
jgi:CspA family cold shock protein